MLKQQLDREVNGNARDENNGYAANSCFLLACPHSLPSSLPAVSSLRSTLKVHLEQNDLTPLQGLEFKPEDITLRHKMDVLNVAMQQKKMILEKGDNHSHMYVSFS